MWREIYRDNGMLVFKSRKLILEVRVWRYKFQQKVDEIECKDYLQVTCDYWNPGGCPFRYETRKV